MESSCLICGMTMYHGENNFNHSQNNAEDLKRLLVTTCKLLDVTSIRADAWNFLRPSFIPQRSICCAKCFELLRNAEDLHENILRIKRELQAHLKQIQTLVVKSEQLQVKDWSWNWNCFEFRKHIITSVSGAGSNARISQLCKKECDVEENDNGYHDFAPDDDIDFEHQNQDASQDDDSFAVPQIPNFEIKAKPEIIVEETALFDKKDNLPENPDTTVNISQTKNNERSRKRKIIVIAEEDEPENAQHSIEPVTESTTEVALKCDISSDNDNDKNNDCDSASCENVIIESAEDDNDSVEVTGDDTVREPSNTKKKRIRNRWKPGDPPKLRGRGSYYPFVVADGADILIYKFSTYILKTHTHLICKAHNCSFQTEFDYFQSFQLMRKHIEDNHRSRRHRDRGIHPCLLCKSTYNCQFELKKHIRATHRYLLSNKTSQAICECCLALKSPKTLREHQFSHKNAAEKDHARQIGDGNARCLDLKESEISERNFICDWENCTAAFKSTRNMLRHRQSHLPKEQRSDVVVCPECGELMVKDSLSNHMVRIHHPETITDLKICPICDKKFLPKDHIAYEDHIRRNHRREKPFLCSECGAAFSSRSSMSAHVKNLHQDLGPLPCKWCDAVYTKVGSLNNHIQRKHPDQWMSKPSLKKKSKFYYDEEVERLKKERFIGPIQQFPCPICDVVCKYKFTLKKHMLKHDRPPRQGAMPQSSETLGMFKWT